MVTFMEDGSAALDGSVRIIYQAKPSSLQWVSKIFIFVIAPTRSPTRQLYNSLKKNPLN